eukprot:scaffold23908_cov36-Tisochrysis_lutea.AAC.5
MERMGGRSHGYPQHLEGGTRKQTPRKANAMANDLANDLNSSRGHLLLSLVAPLSAVDASYVHTVVANSTMCMKGALSRTPWPPP